MNKRILGLDVGERRIGVALSDPEGILAVPVAVIARVEVETDLQAILGLVRQYEAVRVVVGLPYSMDGSVGRQAQEVQDFVNHLAEHVPVPVVTWDERFSTVAAQKMRRNAGAKRVQKKERIDASAAAIILQGYLDRMQSQGGGPARPGSGQSC